MIKARRILILCTLILLACTPKHQRRIPMDYGREMSPLSVNNPYLSSNLLISKMMEDSSYFYNFIASQGAPLAISVIGSQKQKPSMVNLYYPNNTLFVAEAEEYKEQNKMQWFVRGPYQSNWRYAKSLNYLDNEQKIEPAIHVFGEAQRFRSIAYSKNANNNVRVLEPLVPPEPKLIIREVPVKVFVTKTEEEKVEEVKKKEPVSNDPLVKMNGSATVPLNTDQQALLISQGYARRDINGDLLHEIKEKKEKFIAIVNWYTGSTDNTTKIQLANKNIEDIHQMPVGTLVRIPLDMIKEYHQMPDAANVLKKDENMNSLRKAAKLKEDHKKEEPEKVE